MLRVQIIQIFAENAMVINEKKALIFFKKMQNLICIFI